jgi:hypothetical protein
MLFIVGSVSASDSNNTDSAIGDTNNDAISVDNSHTSLSESSTTQTSSSNNKDKQSATKDEKTKTSNSQKVKQTKTNDDTLKSESEGNFTDLKTDIAGSEVTLAKDYVQDESESSIVINETKTIDGNGHKITATKGIFTINSGVTFTLKNTNIFSEYSPTYKNYYYDLYNNGNLIVDNVTFTYTQNWGTRTYGYPIYIESNSILKVNNSVFRGYDTNGALIYGNGAKINIEVDNSVFTNYNTANTAIYMRYAGNLNLTNSNFTNAGASQGSGINYGGALYLNNVNQNAYIDNCIFDNISSSYRGGAMYVSGNTIVKNSQFKNLKQIKDTNNC